MSPVHPARAGRSLAPLLLGAFLFCTAGCRTLAPWPAVDLSEPGWTVRHGQALWRPAAAAEELAGELTVATHPDGRSFIQFTKIPLPVVVAHVWPDRWQIQFFAEDRTIRHRGPPPLELAWLQLPRFLSGAAGEDEALHVAYEFQGSATNDWSLLHRETGERIAGFLNP